MIIMPSLETGKQRFKMLHCLPPDSAVNGGMRTPADSKVFSCLIHRQRWHCVHHVTLAGVCVTRDHMDIHNLQRSPQKCYLSSSLSLIPWAINLHSLPKFAHKGHQYLVPTHLYTVKSNALARTMYLQFTLTTTSFTSSLLFCFLHLGHSFSPLHLDNFPELSRLLLMLSDDFLGLLWPTCASIKALGALWWLRLCPYSFHLWALVFCWPLPLHRKFSGNAERWILGCLRL